MLQALIHLISLLKNIFIPLQAEVGKQDVKKLVNVASSLNNLNSKLHDLNVDNLKTFPVNKNKC